jgi:hypothetical protein
LLLLLPLSFPAFAEEAPRPPCETASTYPAFPDADAPPVIVTWRRDQLVEPPACVGWPARRFDLVLALAGAFRSDATAEELLARIGAVSSQRGVSYWSITDHRWRVLIEDAYALTTADLRERRSDFTASEMKGGADLYLAQKDNRSTSPVIYRMRVQTLAPEQLTITVENVTPVRFYAATLFAPGDVRSVYFLRRLAPGVWGFYSLGGVVEGGVPWLSQVSAPSFANRAVAIFRHLAGIPTDREPPYAR